MHDSASTTAGKSNSQCASKTTNTSTAILGNHTFSYRGSHHRRAHSDTNFRLPNNLDLASDPFDAPTTSFEEIGSEDDLFSTYMDVEKLGSRIEDCYRPGENMTAESQIEGGNGVDQDRRGGGAWTESGKGEKPSKLRHQHSNSNDGSFNSRGDDLLGDVMEAKKAMPPDKLAELWTIDPKRAKRILANRHSAARSKERKARYILELERKMQMLQTEATTLSAQLTLFQRDMMRLSTENTELKLRLQAMEQQAQLRDALNEALKQEVERLKIATGDSVNTNDSVHLGTHYMPCSSSSIFSLRQQPGPGGHQNIYMQFHSSRHNLTNHTLQAAQSELQQVQLSRLEGLAISGGTGPHLVNSEGPSISASESSSTL